jgi:hypothetical protein
MPRKVLGKPFGHYICPFVKLIRNGVQAVVIRLCRGEWSDTECFWVIENLGILLESDFYLISTWYNVYKETGYSPPVHRTLRMVVFPINQKSKITSYSGSIEVIENHLTEKDLWDWSRIG